MITIINYIRSLFCKHDFEYEERNFKKYDLFGEVVRNGIKASMLCKKCGYHKSFWKF